VSEKHVTYSKDLSLSALSTAMSGDESRIGTLLKFECFDNSTAATFTRGLSPDTPLQLVTGTVAPSGHTAIFTGKAWISGQQQDATAYR